MPVLKEEIEYPESDGQSADETESLTGEGQSDDEEELQRRLHSSAMRFIGTIQKGDPNLAENARLEVKARIRARFHAKR